MTSIEWTDESWNPIRARLRSDPTVIGWHCEHASPGCEHCYSETRNRSGRCNMGTKLPYKPSHRRDIEVFLDEAQLLKPLRWKKGRKIFVCSMSDLFADFVTGDMLDRIFAVMALCPQHTFQVLTKRSARMREYFANSGDFGICHGTPRRVWQAMYGVAKTRAAAETLDSWYGGPTAAQWPLPNVWLGVSVEDQQRADERIPDLLATPAALRWISAEPLLGPVDLTRIMEAGRDECFRGEPKIVKTLDGRSWSETRGNLNSLTGHYWGEDLIDGQWEDWLGEGERSPGFDRPGYYKPLDWVVVGGESGTGARPMHPDWARSLRDQCAAAGVTFFFKQWGEWAPIGWEHAGSKHLVTGDGFIVPKALADMKRNQYGHGLIEVAKLGKKRAGRRLDGALHDGMPGVHG